MNPNHYLAVAISYLYGGARPGWPDGTAIGKTLVSSSLIDRVAAKLGRRLLEVPVGFKWFVPGLVDGSVGFGGEESAGASFLRKDGTVWTTDKDGILPALLASEILATTGKSPSVHHRELVAEFGRVLVRPGRRGGHPRGEGDAGQAHARAGHRDHAGGRGDHRAADRGARQRRVDRRPEGHHGERLVRRPAVRHRGRLQDLRRVVRVRGAPGAGAGGGEGRGLGGAGRLARLSAGARAPGPGSRGAARATPSRTGRTPRRPGRWPGPRRARPARAWTRCPVPRTPGPPRCA